MLPRVCDSGGVPAGFCWGWEKGGREVEDEFELVEPPVCMGLLRGGIEKDEGVPVGVAMGPEFL